MQLSFHHNLGLGSLLLLMLALGAIVALFYRRVFESGRDRRLWTLVALRVGALCLIVLLLYRPVISLERSDTREGRLVILIDTSASMSVRDDPQGRSRLEQAQQGLLENEALIDRTFAVEPWRFDTRLESLRQLSAAGELEAVGSGTDLSGALQAVAEGPGNDRIIAIVALSDGINNSTQDLVATAEDLGMPVHTVATGYRLAGSDAGRDVMVSGVECPEQLPLKTLGRLTALIDNRGLQGRVAQVELVEDHTVIASASVVLDDVPGAQRVELHVTPETKGRHEYTVRIPKLSEELIDHNNRHVVSTVVVDARLRVLYVEGGIRAEYGTLVGRYLSHDPALEFLALVQTRPGLFVQRTNIPDWDVEGIPDTLEQLKLFDVFILGDLDSEFLGEQRMAHLESLVREGKGLLMLGGRHSFVGGHYAQTPLARVLPVEFEGQDPRQINEPFRLQLTAAGRSHAVFSNISGFFGADDPGEAARPDDLPQLPELLGCTAIERLKPSAEVLCVHPELGNEQGPLPVLAVHQYGQGRAAAFAADTTHRWYQVMRGLQEESPYIRFWGQLLRWLSGKKNVEALQPGLTVNTDKGFYLPGEEIVLEAVYIGSDGRGVDDAYLDATFTAAGADTPTEIVALSAAADRPGTYLGHFSPEDPGLYSVRVEARLREDGEVAEEAAEAVVLQVQMGTPSREYDELDLNEAALQAVAEVSGGRYVHVARIERLFEGLVNEQREARILAEQPLYHSVLFWMLCVGLVTSEWLLRRKYRLR